jgi:signal transduction histidine kinase
VRISNPSPAVAAVGALILVLLSCAPARAAQPTDEPPGVQKRVLVLHQLRRDSPLSIGMEEIYRSVLGDALGSQLDYYSEYLDVFRFSDSRSQSVLREYLRDRYADRHFDVIIATTTAALRLIRNDSHPLFSDVPVVFHGGVGVTAGPHSTGIVSRVDTTGTLAIALGLQPALTHVTVISGNSEIDRSYAALARDQLKAFEDRVSITYLTGLPMDDLQRAVVSLRDGVIYYISVSEDGANQRLLPTDALERLSAMARVPVYSFHEAALGYGIVGGRLFSSNEVARRTASLALRVLRGEDPDRIPVTEIEPYVTQFDWRQLQRWGLDQARLPVASAVLFQPRGVWERAGQYKLTVIAAASLLAALTATLWFEHTRRERAEARSRRYLATMAVLDRRAAVNHLTASLVHELNQPLGAILRNSDAARIMLDGGQPDLAELRDIVEDIRKDDKRAAGIICNIRALVRKHELTAVPLDLNDVVRSALELAEPAARARGIRVQTDLDPEPTIVGGDAIHLQQVLVNVLLNGVDAMSGTPGVDRLLTITSGRRLRHAEVTVADTGPGLDDESITRMFEPFFTTKSTGMGLGLFIARSIVEAHNGRIAASRNDGPGLTVRISLPLSTPGA